MTKRLIAMLFVIAMVISSFALVACDSDTDGGNNGDGTATTTTTTTTQKTAKVKYTVTLVDSLTGFTLESVKTTEGSKPTFFTNVKNLYYGYTLDEDDYNNQLVAATGDYTITLKYTESPLLYFTVLNKNGNAITPGTKTFTFHKALTVDEIKANYTAEQIKGGAAENAYKDEQTLPDSQGRVWQYKGATFSAVDDFASVLPKVIGSTFDGFYQVKSLAEVDTSIGGFDGTMVEADAIIRAAYTVNEAILYKQDFHGKSIAEICTAISVAAKDPLTAAYPNTIVGGKTVYTGYDSSKNETLSDPSGLFVYAGGMGEGFAWSASNTYEFGSLGSHGLFTADSSNPAHAFNHYTGKLAGTYGAGYNIQIDNNYYMTYDGSKVYVLILVRDDTVTLEKGTVTKDLITGEDFATPVNYDYLKFMEDQRDNGGSTWAIVDYVEFRYYFGDGIWEGTDGSGQKKYNYDYAKGYQGSLRCLGITASGNFVYNYADTDAMAFTPKGGGEKVKMSDYAEVVDINPTDPNLKSVMLKDTQGNINGYELCVALDVKGFYEAMGEKWADVESFDIIVGSQIDDCIYPLRRLQGEWVTVDNEDWNCKQAQMTVGTGTQQKADYFSKVTLVNGSAIEE